MTEVRAAYDTSGSAWSGRPTAVYRHLAAALLDTLAEPVTGLRVLDVGAGTAVAAEQAVLRGAAYVVAVDAAIGMLEHRPPGMGAAVADATALPFADGAFDLSVLAFVLGHLDDPVAALREARRVAPQVAASAFDASWSHPAKAAVDDVMGRVGFEAPDWYAAMKATEGRVSDQDGLADLARSAGFADVLVRRVDVPTGLEGPDDLVDWRWGMAHLAPFVATLDPAARGRARAGCLAAVAGLEPVIVPMLALSAQ